MFLANLLRFANLCSCFDQHRTCTACQLLVVRRPCVAFWLAKCGPTEPRHQLVRCRTTIGEPRCRRLPQPVCGIALRDAGYVAHFSEPVSKARCSERLAKIGREEGEIVACHGSKCFRQLRQQGHTLDQRSRLSCPIGEFTIAYMLAPKADNVAAARTDIQ